MGPEPSLLQCKTTSFVTVLQFSNLFILWKESGVGGGEKVTEFGLLSGVSHQPRSHWNGKSCFHRVYMIKQDDTLTEIQLA